MEAPLPPPKTVMGTEEPPPGAALNVVKLTGWKISLAAGTLSTLHKQDPELIALLCLDEVGQFFMFPLHRKVCRVAWAWWPETGVALEPLGLKAMEEPNTIMQVTRKSL